MLKAHLFKAPPGRFIPSLNHRIQPVQMIPSECQGGEMCDHLGSKSFVPGVWVTDDNANFAVSMDHINMFQRPVANQRLVSVHREELMLGSGKVLRIPRLDLFERQDALS